MCIRDREIYYRIRKHFDQVPREIQKSCMDFFNQFNYWGRLDPEKGVYEEIEEKGQALFAHMEDFVWLYHHLGDYRSKKTLYAILNNWYRYDFTTTAQAKEYLFDDYFDLDLVSCSTEEVVCLLYTSAIWSRHFLPIPCPPIPAPGTVV